MTAPVITAVTAFVPDTIPLWSAIESAKRANSHRNWDAWMQSWHPDYGHWLEAWPGEDTGDSHPVHSSLTTPRMTCKVPVDTGPGLSELAAKVARVICSARSPNARPLDVIVFCHSSPDEHLPVTIAGRLCAEVGPRCFPFSVSQQHGVSPFTALRLAADLFVAEPDIHTILIVAAEKWHPLFSRICEPAIVHGDAAGALLVERASYAPSALQLLDAETRHVPVHIRRRAAGTADMLTSTLRSMIELLLGRHGLRHGDIDEVLGHPGMPSLTDARCELPGRPNTRAQHEPCVHLGAAQSIVQLARAPSRSPRCGTHRILVWGYGTSGFVGTALLQAYGTPLSCQQSDVRSVS